MNSWGQPWSNDLGHLALARSLLYSRVQRGLGNGGATRNLGPGWYGTCIEDRVGIKLAKARILLGRDFGMVVAKGLIGMVVASGMRLAREADCRFLGQCLCSRQAKSLKLLECLIFGQSRGNHGHVFSST